LNFFVGPTDFGLARSVDALTYPILGGVNSLAGPAIGAVFTTVLPEALRFSNQLREILMGALVVAIVLFLPGGAMSVLKWRWNFGRFGFGRSDSPRTEP
jgi:branched-chain amino acid transport system permease protein